MQPLWQIVLDLLRIALIPFPFGKYAISQIRQISALWSTILIQQNETGPVESNINKYTTFCID